MSPSKGISRVITPAEVAEVVLEATLNTIERMLEYPAARAECRLLIRRGLAYTEPGPRSDYYIEHDEKIIHPVSKSDNWANRQSNPCVVCGWSRSKHGDDGQRPDCDGYIASK